MKKLVILSVATALVLFSGCSKDPEVVEPAEVEQEVVAKKAPAKKVDDVKTETVNVESSIVLDTTHSESNSNSNSEASMSELQDQLTTVYFGFDSFSIDADNSSKVSNTATAANTVASAYNVKLEGNCDEWGSDEYNFALGLKRANAVKQALIAEGVNSQRITMVTFGENNPACSDKSQECWSKNRRVDYKLLP